MTETTPDRHGDSNHAASTDGRSSATMRSVLRALNNLNGSSPMRRFLKNYVERHLHPANQLFHLVGLPVTFILPVHFLVWSYPPSWAMISFVIGYMLQFVGHAIEGNDAGEWILIKRCLGRPYVEFGPRHPSRAGEKKN